jgi:catechol 2,3-dioxygenase-like lactoylglutathione lyase family enzyme
VTGAVRVQPMLQVADVAASGRWYHEALGLDSAHGGDEYDMLVTGGVLVLQLHRWDAHDHPFLGVRTEVAGNGVSLWFETDTFDPAVTRAVASGATVLDGPSYNPNADHRELVLRDPDGYVVVLASPFGDRGDAPKPDWA